MVGSSGSSRVENSVMHVLSGPRLSVMELNTAHRVTSLWHSRAARRLGERISRSSA